MARTENAIVIDRPLGEVFDATNDLERWTNLFTEYQEVKILNRDGNRITFELATVPDAQGKSYRWRSTRLIDRPSWRATAEREEPKLPFRYMHITWTYREAGGGTEMTWIQEFEMDPASGVGDEQAVNYINTNTKVQMAAIKERLEQEGARDGA